jgi:benzoate-CoA ligase
MPLNAAELILARSMEPAIRLRTAIHFNGGVVTYAELHALINRAANAFIGMGVQRGDRVPILLNDSPTYAACVLGLMKMGAVVIPLNTKLKPEEYKFIAADSGAKWLVHDPVFAEVLGEVAGTRLLPTSGGFDSLRKRMDLSPPQTAFVQTEAEDPCFWLYSSGTTGVPKGIIHSHRSAAQTSKLMREVLKIDETSTVFCTSKLFFAFAFDNALLGVLRAGAATVLNEAWADPETVIAQAERIRPDALLTVPTFFRRLLQLPEERLAVFRDIPLYATGGERVPDSVAIKWKEVTGHDLLACHGMSETFCNTFSNRVGEVRLGSCGKPLEGVEPMLLAAGARPGELFAAAEPIGVNEPGVLWLKHPSLALRYNNAQKTAEAFEDGWFCTNDLFRVDADGYWFHEGRGDELLKIAGQWVKPLEVEDAVLGERVREAACVVVPDADGFERLALYVVPAEEGSMEVIEESARAALPSHSWPKWIRAVDELPRTPTGKVQKFRLRQMLRTELGFPEEEKPLVPEPPVVEDAALAPEKKKRSRPRKPSAAQAAMGELPLEAALAEAQAEGEPSAAEQSEAVAGLEGAEPVEAGQSQADAEAESVGETTGADATVQDESMSNAAAPDEPASVEAVSDEAAAEQVMAEAIAEDASEHEESPVALDEDAPPEAALDDATSGAVPGEDIGAPPSGEEISVQDSGVAEPEASATPPSEDEPRP